MIHKIIPTTVDYDKCQKLLDSQLNEQTNICEDYVRKASSATRIIYNGILYASAKVFPFCENKKNTESPRQPNQLL